MTRANRPADAVLELALGREPTLGPGRLVCIDGPAGSGKTTLAAALAAPTIHMDDLFEGWSGLARVDVQLDGLLRPLAAGTEGSYRRYDWEAGAFAETVVVPPTPMLVLEGVGSGSARFEDLQTVLVWVEAPYDVRMARGIARDGDTFAPHWEQWAQDEAELFARERTRDRADLLVDATR
ncbi:MAG: 4-amino-4-deoxy-L-arabinose transferase [Marmoricola sp.]